MRNRDERRSKPVGFGLALGVPMPAGMVQHAARRIDHLVGATQYSPVPNADPEVDGETGTWRGAGTTNELLGFNIGAGATYGAGGTCANAIPAGRKTVARERQQMRVKYIERSLSASTTTS